jgi:uncharacterized protein with PQ loop repeat
VLGPVSENNIIIGLAAEALGIFPLFPQLLKVLNTKSAKDLSLGMPILFPLAYCCCLFMEF